MKRPNVEGERYDQRFDGETMYLFSLLVPLVYFSSKAEAPSIYVELPALVNETEPTWIDS